MVDMPMVVHPFVLQQFAAAHGLPLNDIHAKIIAQSQYINFFARSN